MQILPPDEHNQALVANVHPPDWVNPQPPPRYHLVVIGAGTAGLVSAAGAAGLGARVALIERDFMGGDCLNVGCVPSKAILRAARAWADVRDAGRFGVEVPPGVRVNFPAVMERMRRLRASISPNDSAQRFRNLGVDVFFGQARFTGKDNLAVVPPLAPEGSGVGGEGTPLALHFRRAIIATGARPTVPPIPGLKEASFLTNETIFSLTELPPRLAVVGAGPIGCELAQAFARFGSRVSLIANHDRLLPRDDPDAARLVENALRTDGVEILFHSDLQRVSTAGPEKTLHLQRRVGFQPAAPIGQAGSLPYELPVDAILVAVGRTPNVDSLELEKADVAFDLKEGIHVNDHLRTTNRRIFAAGDVCSRFKYTHAADAMARIAIQNALFPGRAKMSALTIPHCTYTDPEIAHVGLLTADAEKSGISIATFVQELAHVDRAILDGETEGFVKVHVRQGTDRIVGATVVGRHAGDMISELTLAMVGKLGLGSLASTIHPYPTQAEAIKKVADAYNRTRLKPWVQWLLARWFAWT